LSSFKDRRKLSDIVPDVNGLSNRLNLNKFAVLSWSGGGPFALTYTALNPKRVTHALIVGCPALPFDPATAHNSNRLAKIAMKYLYLSKFALRHYRKNFLSASRDINHYLEFQRGKNMLSE
jgi:pimeloyl-ACP methyl ester carboxylesterase